MRPDACRRACLVSTHAGHLSRDTADTNMERCAHGARRRPGPSTGYGDEVDIATVAQAKTFPLCALAVGKTRGIGSPQA